MRPGQQNKRSRGRGNGRKNVNPLSRNYESNGPDVKVRGNASHIAEKYVQLARDAQASGDSVMAENYFQHAEHYFRIISAAQAQNQARQEQRREREEQDRGQDRDGENRDAENRNADDKSDEATSSEQDAVEATSKEEVISEQPAANDEDAQEKPKRAPRARRPRRKPVAEGDLADAPQPKLSVGDDVAEEVPAKKAAAAE
jgi:hypothetical protein